VHPATKVALDVHYDAFQIGLTPQDEGGIWCRAMPVSIANRNVMTPALNDSFLLLAVHVHRHGFDRLIWLKDLDLMVRKFGDQLDWLWIAATAHAEGVESSVKLVLQLLWELWETPLPPQAACLKSGVWETLMHSVMWPSSHILDSEPRRFRGRRVVQFIPGDGLRGFLPSLLLMGRRRDKLRSLVLRLRGGRVVH
jgi:hypothetical protein